MGLKDTFLNSKNSVYKGLNTYFGTSIQNGESLDEIIENKESLRQAIKSDDLLDLLIDYREDKLQYSKTFIKLITETLDGLKGLESHGSFFGRILDKYSEGRQILFNSPIFVERLMKSILIQRVDTGELVDEFYAIAENRELVKKKENCMSLASLTSNSNIIYKTLAILQDLDFTLYPSYSSDSYSLWANIADSSQALEYLSNLSSLTSNATVMGYTLSGMGNKKDSNFPKLQSIANMVSANDTTDGNLGQLIEMLDIDILNMMFHPSWIGEITNYCANNGYADKYTGYYGSNLPTVLSKKLMSGRRVPLIGYPDGTSTSYAPNERQFVKFINDGINGNINSTYGGYYWQPTYSSAETVYSMIKTPMLNLTNISKVYLSLTIKRLHGKPSIYFGVTDNPDITKSNYSSSYYCVQEYMQLNPQDTSKDDGSTITFTLDVSHLNGDHSLVLIHRDSSNTEAMYAYLDVNDFFLEY